MKSILNERQARLLEILRGERIFREKFYFTGGTALAEYYLHHRLSEDLDFFAEEEIDVLWLATLAKKLKGGSGASASSLEQSFNRNLVGTRLAL